MCLLRQYVMIAKDAQIELLRTELMTLATKVRPLEGCDGVEIYQDQMTANRFVFIERWRSAELHQAGGKTLGKQVFAPIMAALAAPPEAATLSPITIA